MPDQYTVPAGWYPDPLGHPQLRWWNGEGWTEQVSAAPEPLVMQPSNYAWKQEDAAPVVVQVAAEPARAEPAKSAPAAMTPAAREIFALEAPRAAAKIEQPAAPTLPAAGYTNNYKLPPAGQAPAAAAQPEAGYTKYAATTPEPVPVPVSSTAQQPPKFWNA